VIFRNSPYRLRFRYDRGTAREYVHFSTPLLFSSLSSLILMQSMTLLARSTAGLAGVGALSLANSVRTYTAFADGIISSAMYPAVCAVKDRVDLMFESFVKSNRLALMWGFPAGVGVALFAPDLIAYVLGHRWDSAIFVLQMVGLVSAIGHIAFNWDDYVRATGDTRPVMKYAWIGLIGWAIGPIPLLATHGLDGYGIGLLIVAALNFAVRGYFMRRMFPGFAMARHGLRAIGPTVPAVLAVLGLRLVEPTTRSFGVAAVELVAYVGVTAMATWMAERALLREAAGYLRRMRARPATFAT
jgi:O-antigen/teichoic acid export membrane protein